MTELQLAMYLKIVGISRPVCEVWGMNDLIRCLCLVYALFLVL